MGEKKDRWHKLRLDGYLGASNVQVRAELATHLASKDELRETKDAAERV